MKKQTAVEWLLDELMTEMGYGRDMSRIDNKRILDEITKEAKEMEKEQMIAFANDVSREILNENIHSPFSIEQYYNETYGKQ